MNDALKTQCGRSVYIHGVHLDHFARGIYAGEPDIIRDHVMESLPDRIRDVFRGKSGLYIAPLPDTEENPTWIVLCELHCYDPISPDAHCSMLTCCWFADTLDQPIAQFVSPLVAGLTWAEHAVDGHY